SLIGSPKLASVFRRTSSRTSSWSSDKLMQPSPASSGGRVSDSALRRSLWRCTAAASGSRAKSGRAARFSSLSRFGRKARAYERANDPLYRRQRVQPEDRAAAAQPYLVPSDRGGGRRGRRGPGATGIAESHTHGRAAAQDVRPRCDTGPEGGRQPDY